MNPALISFLVAADGVLTAGYGLLLLAELINWLRIEEFRAGKPSANTFLSVIIAMRNEEENIIHCLESLKQQDYPASSFEVIVVDDHSGDNSISLVKDFIKRNEGVFTLKLLELKDGQEHSSYKKQAISMGITMAKGEVILTTDADCVAGTKWLSTLMYYYETKKPVMMMCPVGFTEKKDLFSRMQSLEFAGLIGMSAATNRSGFPLMCNGANLAYTKKAYEEIGGYGNTPEMASGDDTFLLFKMKERYPDGIHFIKSMQAGVATSAQVSLNAFFMQRKRWASKTTRYNKAYVTLTGLLLYFFNFFLVLTLIASFFHNSFLLPAIIMTGVKLILEFAFMVPVCKFFKKLRLLWIFLPTSILSVPYILVVGLVAPFGGYRWKGRNTR